MSYKRVLLNTSLLTIASTFTAILGFIISILIGRKLGTVLYGQYSFALAFVNLFVVFLDLGTHTVMIRDIARIPSKTISFLSSIISIKLISSLVTFILIFTSSYFLSDIHTTVVLSSCAMIIYSFFSLFQSCFNAHQMMIHHALLTIFNKVLLSTMILVVSFTSLLSVHYLLLAHIVSSSILCIISLILVVNYFGTISFSWDPSKWFYFLQQGLPFATSSILVVLCTKIDISMLKLMDSDSATGLYDAASKLATVVLLLPSNVSTAVFPALSSSFHSDRTQFNDYFNKSLHLLILMALPFGIIVMLLSNPITMFIWGPSFIDAHRSLSFLAWTVSLQFITSLFSLCMNASDRQKTVLLITFFAVLLNIILNIIFIPLYGHPGASFTTLVTNVYFLLSFTFLIRSHIDYVKLLLLIARIVPSCIGLFAFITFYRSHSIILLIPIGIIVYILLILPFHYTFVLSLVKILLYRTFNLLKRIGIYSLYLPTKI